MQGHGEVLCIFYSSQRGQLNPGDSSHASSGLYSCAASSQIELEPLVCRGVQVCTRALRTFDAPKIEDFEQCSFKGDAVELSNRTQYSFDRKHSLEQNIPATPCLAVARTLRSIGEGFCTSPLG